MAPKKKKNAESKEEKAAKLAAKRELKHQKEKDLQITAQHEQLLREIHYGSECVKKHEKQWRALLISIAEPRMRMEVECAMHHFERSIESKDFEISLLLDELKAAEEQYTRSVRSHIDDIDRIIVLCYDQIAELWKESANMISNLYTAATIERSDVIRIDNEHETYLKTMLYSLNENSKDVGKLMRGDYLSRQEVVVSRLNDIAIKFKEKLKSYYDHLWSDAEQFMQKYKTDFARRKMQFEELNKNDDEMQALLAKQWEQAYEAIETIKKLKNEQALQEGSQGKRIQELVDEKEYYENIITFLKKQAKDDRKHDEEILTALSVACSEVLVKLEACVKRGEKLLTLGGICRKYETLEEKTMRFPSFKSFIPEKKNKEVNVVDDHIVRLSVKPELVQHRTSKDKEKEAEEEILAGEEEYLEELQLFWMRVGALESSRLQMTEECARMKAENEQLKRELFNYCQCFNCVHDLKYLYTNANFLE